MDSTTQGITFLIIIAVLMANAVVRRNTRPQRPIAALQAIPTLVNASIETNQPMHLSFGGFGIGAQETILALASADFFYHSARQVALGDASPIVTVGNASTLQVARDVLRRAHRNSKARDEYRPFNVRWYPDTGFAMVAAFSVMTHDDKISSHLLTGNSGSELALPLWGAERAGVPTIAASTRIGGQAVAYALADHVLLGEELFAAPGYFDETSPLKHRTLVIDLLRLVLIAVIVIAFVVNFVGRG